MVKLLSPINTTPDGFSTHSHLIADVELHQFAMDLLKQADTLLPGWITYEL